MVGGGGGGHRKGQFGGSKSGLIVEKEEGCS